jgi:hypothetical protein
MPHIRSSELRQLDNLLTTIVADADLMAQLSLLERECLQAALQTVKRLSVIVELQDVEDTTVNES